MEESGIAYQYFKKQSIIIGPKEEYKCKFCTTLIKRNHAEMLTHLTQSCRKISKVTRNELSAATSIIKKPSSVPSPATSTGSAESLASSAANPLGFSTKIKAANASESSNDEHVKLEPTSGSNTTRMRSHLRLGQQTDLNTSRNLEGLVMNDHELRDQATTSSGPGVSTSATMSRTRQDETTVESVSGFPTLSELCSMICARDRGLAEVKKRELDGVNQEMEKVKGELKLAKQQASQLAEEMEGKMMEMNIELEAVKEELRKAHAALILEKQRAQEAEAKLEDLKTRNDQLCRDLLRLARSCHEPYETLAGTSENNADEAVTITTQGEPLGAENSLSGVREDRRPDEQRRVLRSRELPKLCDSTTGPSTSAGTIKRSRLAEDGVQNRKFPPAQVNAGWNKARNSKPSNGAKKVRVWNCDSDGDEASVCGPTDDEEQKPVVGGAQPAAGDAANYSL